MALIKYQYSSKIAPDVSTSVKLEAVEGDFNNNPIFNFDQKFIDDLNSISSIELGSSLPHISLSILDPDGDILENVNLAFFQKPFDASQISSDVRYSERPVMSLKDITFKTNLASGYLYYTEVIINIKVHRAESLGSTFLMALLFPGMPFLLEYGWNSDNDLLDQKDILLFAVKTYNLKLDGTGQVDLTVEGTAFNERFNNLLIGDIGVAPKNNPNITTEDLDGLDKYKKQLSKYSLQLKEMGTRSDSTINDYSILAQFAEIYKKNENRSRGDISDRFSKGLQKLSNFTEKRDFGPSLKGRDIVKFHDLLYTMCDDTFKALSDTIKRIDEFRIIYGTFNSQAGIYANKSIAEFPIDLKNFRNKIKEMVENGNYVISIERLLNELHYGFFENEEYFKSNLPPNKNNFAGPPANLATFNKPDVISHFISRSQKDPKNPQKQIVVMELYIIDINNGLPITTEQIAKLSRASVDAAEQAIAGATNFPIVRLGHANSFIKSITLDQIADEHMKAVLIERMTRDRVVGHRDAVTQKDSLGENPTAPRTLPLRGTASVIGHPNWKPFRAFYLSTGLFLIDGIYKITSVSHSLSAGQYNTSIEFMWH